MATAQTQVQVRLRWYALWLLIVATRLAQYTCLRVPHRLVTAVTNRSWQMRMGDGPWQSIAIDHQGRVTR